MQWWWSALLGVVVGVALLWVALVVVVWCTRPDGVGVRDAVRLLPDLVRLVKRLAVDPAMPTGVRVRLWCVLGYLALPVDLIPDFVPVLGVADDAIVVAVVLRSVVRRAGSAAVAAHWPGTPQGLAAVFRLIGLPQVSSDRAHDTDRDQRCPTVTRSPLGCWGFPVRR